MITWILGYVAYDTLSLIFRMYRKPVGFVAEYTMISTSQQVPNLVD